MATRSKRVGKFRSKLESRVNTRLSGMKLNAKYETTKFPYIIQKTYTPDFIVGGNCFFEVKGVLLAPDREKMIAFRKCYPDLNIVFIFEAAHRRVPGMKLTHAKWAEKHNYGWLSADTFTKEDILRYVG